MVINRLSKLGSALALANAGLVLIAAQANTYHGFVILRKELVGLPWLASIWCVFMDFPAYILGSVTATLILKSVS